MFYYCISKLSVTANHRRASTIDRNVQLHMHDGIYSSTSSLDLLHCSPIRLRPLDSHWYWWHVIPIQWAFSLLLASPYSWKASTHASRRLWHVCCVQPMLLTMSPYFTVHWCMHLACTPCRLTLLYRSCDQRNGMQHVSLWHGSTL